MYFGIELSFFPCWEIFLVNKRTRTKIIDRLAIFFQNIFLTKLQQEI